MRITLHTLYTRIQYVIIIIIIIQTPSSARERKKLKKHIYRNYNII
jgi:hypothetical protein